MSRTTVNEVTARERQPETEAGKSMLQAWIQRSWSRMALRLAILAIEDEARAVPAPGLDAAMREAILAVPMGTFPKPGLASVAGWNRYDTDDEHVLHLWSSDQSHTGKSWDLRAPRAVRASSPEEESRVGPF